jgi:thiosulfate dehydrogenase (quinone) large subunit
MLIINGFFQNILLQLHPLFNIFEFMKENKIFTPMQRYVLLVLRLLIGWHILYEGFSKLLIPNWSSQEFLNESKWILSGFSHWIISHPDVLNVVDFLNTWGLIAIGAGLILGLFTRLSALSGAILLFVYYLTNPPLIGLEYSVPSEGNYLIISKTLIESVALVALAVFPSGLFAGLDILVHRFRNRNNKMEE